MSPVLLFIATVLGLLLGTFLFARVGAWIAGILEALKAQRENEKTIGKASSAPLLMAVLLHSGPWLLGAVGYWAHHMLRGPNAQAWLWFFGAVVVSIPIWIAVTVYLHIRSKRTAAKDANAKHAV